MGKRREWTDEEINKAIELYNSGENFTDIGEKIGRSKVSVNKKIKALGIHKPTRKGWEQEEVSKAIKLYKEGKNFAEIGEEIRRCEGSVRNKLKSLGYTAKQKHMSEAEVNKVIEMYKEGKNITEIAKEIDRSRPTIHKKLMGLGYVKVKPRNSYLYRVGQYVNVTLKILKQTRNKRGKAYIVQSVVYPNAEPYEVGEYSLKQGVGCAYKQGFRVCPENSLWSVESIRPYINEQEALKVYKGNSREVVKVSCADCSTKKTVLPRTLTNYGFSCLCNTGASYGQLAFGCYQTYMMLGFESEQTIDGLLNRRVDFVNFKTYQIVEVHGKQHYKNESWNGAYESSQEQDKAKREFANNPNNPYSLIELDMRKSTWKQFKQSINKCKSLPNINKEDEKAILKMIENNKRYPVKEIKYMYEVEKLTTHQIAEIYDVNYQTITSILQKNDVKLRNTGAIKKMVRCVTTGEVFGSCREAERKTGVNNSTISQCAKGKLKHAGKHPITNDFLHFKYVSESECYVLDQAQQRANEVNESISLDESDEMLKKLRKDRSSKQSKESKQLSLNL